MSLPDLSRLSLLSPRCQPCSKHYDSWIVDGSAPPGVVVVANDPDERAARHPRKGTWTPDGLCTICGEELRRADENPGQPVSAPDGTAYVGALDVEALIENPACGHSYHLNCLRSAIERGMRQCPNCRENIDQSVLTRLAPAANAVEGEGNAVPVDDQVFEPLQRRIAENPDIDPLLNHRRMEQEWLARANMYLEGVSYVDDVAVAGLGRMPYGENEPWRNGQLWFAQFVNQFRLLEANGNAAAEYQILLLAQACILKTHVNEGLLNRITTRRRWIVDWSNRGKMLIDIADRIYDYWKQLPDLESSEWRQLTRRDEPMINGFGRVERVAWYGYMREPPRLTRRMQTTRPDQFEQVLELGRTWTDGGYDPRFDVYPEIQDSVRRLNLSISISMDSLGVMELFSFLNDRALRTMQIDENGSWPPSWGTMWLHVLLAKLYIGSPEVRARFARGPAQAPWGGSDPTSVLTYTYTETRAAEASLPASGNAGSD